MLRRLKNDLTIPFFCFYGFALLQVLLPEVTGHALPKNAQILGLFINYLLVSMWLMDDARRHRFSPPMSYGMMMILALFLFAPLYLFETRGWWAFQTIATYLIIWVGLGVLCALILAL